jgi:photosystem II stability/assembly factor-like uncharacterized protein
MPHASTRIGVSLGAALLALAGSSAHMMSQPSAAQSSLDPALSKALTWRSIGPLRGGRSITISGVKGRPKEGYFGATGGGLWKTTDGGGTWTPVTDGQIHSSSVGAVAVSESNPDIVFIGMGESCIRGNIQPGDGVYKSTDAGKTWTHAGFSASQAISKIRIHPTNPQIVFVASFGRYASPSDERGIFKSTDGGQTWQRKLFRDAKTGGVDLAIDPRNPNVVFAALWEAFRVEYQMSSGGPGSGLFKSTDGGEHWTEITRNPGLPSGVVGKIGVAISAADSNRVYAIVENENGGLFSSDDGGATWKLANEGRNLRQRAFYYTHVAADPKEKDTVYVLNVGTFKSTDGGKTMTSFAAGDSHDLWIDPDDTQHIMHASDSGGAVTYNAASPQRTWTARDYATGQFYHAATTAHVPYHVCGAQQDSSTICVPSETNLVVPGGPSTSSGQAGRGGRGGGGRGGPPATYAAGGSEPGYIAPDPKDPDIFYSGGNNGSFLIRLNRKTEESREVGPYPRMFSGEPSSALVERWQWTYPIIFSPVDPRVLYTSSQHVWKTTNGGQSWEKISGDLTRHDPKTLGESGGPITKDMNAPEVYATVFALGPGKTDVNVLWAGSDDGVVSVTRDGGQTWAAVTPKQMPDFGRVSQIDASIFDAGSAYVAVKKPLLDDLKPYIFKTHDYGRTWTRIVNGLGPSDYVHVVREDRARRGLLYAGTQHGVYVSYDDGDHWGSLALNLPDVQISDLVVEDNDLVIATHGRGFYVLDNIAPVRDARAITTAAEAYLFKPGDAIRGAGGATIIYFLRKPAQNLRLEILDSNGTVVTSIAGATANAAGRGRGRGQPSATGTGEAGAPDPAAAGAEEGTLTSGRASGQITSTGSGQGGRGGGPPTTSMVAGLNRTTWNLDYPGPLTFPGMVLWGAATTGPAALPGTYQVRLTVDGQSQTQPLTVRRHPFRSATDADLREQFDLAIQIRDKVSEANNAVIQIRAVKQKINERLAKSPDAQLADAAGKLTVGLTAVEEAIYQVRNQSSQDPLNFPIRINNRIASLLRAVNTGDGKPIANAYPIFKDLTAELKVQTDKLHQVLDTDLPAFNGEARRVGVEPVVVK